MADAKTVKELGKAFGKQRKQQSSLWSKLLKESAKKKVTKKK